MNKKIQELIEKNTVKVSNEEGSFIKEDFNKEEFAKMILLEVAEICKTRAVSNLDIDVIRNSGKFTLQELATNNCGENLSEIILKHFGIK